MVKSADVRRDALVREPILRSMRPDDFEAVHDLILVAFGDGWPNLPIQVSRLEHLKWKTSSPRLVPDSIEVAELDDRVVGFGGSIGRDVWVQGKCLAGEARGDWAVHPNVQGLGLTSAWRDWSAARKVGRPEPVGLGEGSTHPRLLRSQKRRGNRVFIANKVDRLTLHLVAPSIRGGGSDGFSVRSVLRAARMRMRRVANRRRWGPYAAPAPALTIRTVERFDSRADTLWTQAKEAFDYAVVRDRQYLNWRYCDPRAGIYKVRGVERDGELVGYVVTAFNGGDSQLVDILAIPGDEGALRALVEDAISTVRDEGGASLTVLMPRAHAYREVFQRYGFIKTNHISNMGYGERKDSVLDFLEADGEARLHVAFGDTDHI